MSRESTDTEPRQRLPVLMHRDAVEHMVETNGRLAALEQWAKDHERAQRDRAELFERMARAEQQNATHQAIEAFGMMLGEFRSETVESRKEIRELIGKLNETIKAVDETRVPWFVWPALSASAVIIAVAFLARFGFAQELAALIK